jgi:hypothetical protein
VLTYTLVFFLGFALFLLGMSVFMYLENQKFGDNQHTVKLLPPPPKRSPAVLAAEAMVMADWVAGSPLSEEDLVPARKDAEPGFSRAA